MEWLDFVQGGDDRSSCFCLNLHIFSNGPIVMLEVKLLNQGAPVRYQAPQRLEA